MSYFPLIIHSLFPEKDILPFISFQRKENNPDFIEINKESEGINIEIIRDIQSKILERPYKESFRLFVIYGAESMNAVCQNALLKLLEEPPQYIQFILVTHSPSLLLATIRSRCRLVSTKISSSPNQSEGEDVLIPKNIPEIIEWAEKVKDRQEALTMTFALLTSIRNQMEKKPQLKIIQKLKILRKTYLLLQENTNIRLSLEWMGFQLKNIE